MKYELVGETTKKDIQKKIKLANKEFAVNVLFVCGGKSFEHDISILTAQIVANTELEKYNIFVLYQSLDGDFYLMPKDLSVKKFKSLEQGIKVRFATNTPKVLSEKGKPLFRVDVAVVCAHGQNCEDGAFAHLFSMCDIASTSFNATSLAVTLDKEFMKDSFKASGFNTPEYCIIKQNDYTDLKFALNKCENTSSFDDLANEKINVDVKSLIKSLSKIDFPMIIKPANLGSSIGICTCENMCELISALDFAFKFDTKVLCEKMIDDFIEINCSARKIGNKIVASRCEEPVKHSKFLTFSDKYLGGEKGAKNPCSKIKNNKIEQKTLENHEKNAKNGHFDDNFEENLKNIVEMTKFLHSENDGIFEDMPPLKTLETAYGALQNIWKEIDKNGAEKNNNEKANESNLTTYENFVKLTEHSVPQTVIDDIKKITCALYKKFDCTSVVRVDYLLNQNYEIFVNEINSIPGSLAYYLWDESIADFIEALIISARRAHIERAQKSYYFETHL